MKNLLLCILILGIFACQSTSISEAPTEETPMVSATIDSLLVPSVAMDKTIPASIVLPAVYHQDSSRRFPCVYLLHGYSGRHTSWVDQITTIEKWANLFEVILVLPDGDFNSWYLDSPIKEQHKYATHTGLELPSYIDQNFRTVAQKEGRAITGLSMGGHGAMYLAAQYPNQFGAVGSMSGGLDLRPFPKNWELADILGEASTASQNWEEYSVISQLDRFKDQNIPIYIDCGQDDFFFETNQQAHEKLNQLGIPHEFIVRPGAHTWDYWEKVLPHHLLFFSEFFNAS